MLDVKFVFSELNDLKTLIDSDIHTDICIISIDEKSRKCKKEAYNLKSDWGARKSPFALVLKGDNVIKAFYSEAEDVVNSLIKYLNNYESKCN